MTHTHIQDFFQGVGCLKDNVVCHGGRSGGGGVRGWGYYMNFRKNDFFRGTDPTGPIWFCTCKGKFDWILKER